MQLSDDGQWMWNGTDWVPAPQQAMAPQIPDPTPVQFGMSGMGMAAMNQPQQVVIMQENRSMGWSRTNHNFFVFAIYIIHGIWRLRI